MKIIKKIVLALLVFIVLTVTAGYFYFDKKFSPPENYLHVSGIGNNIPLKWVLDNENQYSAVLLPVQLRGIEQTFYMQLDFGSPVTLFYKKSLQSIQSDFPNEISLKPAQKEISLNFNIKGLNVSSSIFELLDYGKNIDSKNPQAVNIIGTIGTDLLEKRTAIIDFGNNSCSFNETEIEKNAFDFEFKKRKLLFPAKVNGQNLKLLYDSGTSGYELIVNKEEWNKYRNKDGVLKTEKGNSWGNILKVISAPANQKMEFGNTELKISEVTYIEGVSKIQAFLMKRSGMQGMIGNKLFLSHKLRIDCKNEKFKLE